MIQTSLGTLNLMRTNPAHIGSEPLTSVMTQTVRKDKEISKTEKKSDSFESFLLNAMDSVSNKQMESDKIAQQLIVDPDSVDVHDVTIAMAQASLSLNLAQTVIDRVVKDWNEITTTR